MTDFESNHSEFQEHKLWKTICNLIPVRKFSIIIEQHAIIDEKSPFVLYGVEMQSDFSNFIARKRFNDFIKL